jgi:hypothetical protein
MKSFSRLTGSSFLTKSLCGFLATIFIGNFSSAYAQTETNPVPIDSAEALAVDAKLYAQAYGVSQEEAVKRLSIMFDINAAVNAAESEESDDFAGSYIDNNAAQFAVVIRTKKANKADRILRRKARAAAQDPATKAKRRAERRAERKAIRAKLKLTDGEVEQAENILAQDVEAPLKFKGGAANSVRKLQAAIDGSAPNFAAIPGFQTAFVDHKTGEVVLMVDAKSPDVVSAEAAKFLKVPYRIELVPGGFVNTELRGGQFITVEGTRVCMTSFAAKHQDGRTGVVTAGHCKAATPPPKVMQINDGGTNYEMKQGAPIDSPTAGDLMFLSGAPTAVAEFYYDGTGSVRSVTGTMSRADTMAGNGTATTVGTTSGSFVCHLGQDTLGSSKLVQSCGEVVSTTTSRPNNILSFTGGSYVLVRNTQSGAGTVQTTGRGTLRCFKGDSGGPWFGNNTALGVQSSCTWKGGILNGTAEYMLYTSVDAFPSIGVEILVK